MTVPSTVVDLATISAISLTPDQAKDWVIEQTKQRISRQFDAEELAYQQRLSSARKREELMRRAARARVLKKPVESFLLLEKKHSYLSYNRNGVLATSRRVQGRHKKWRIKMTISSCRMTIVAVGMRTKCSFHLRSELL